MQLLKNSLVPNKFINNIANWYILIILLEEIIVLDFKLKNLFFKYIKLFYSYIGRFFKSNKIKNNFSRKFYIVILQNKSRLINKNK